MFIHILVLYIPAKIGAIVWALRKPVMTLPLLQLAGGQTDIWQTELLIAGSTRLEKCQKCH